MGGQGQASVGDRRSSAVQDLRDEAVADRPGTASRKEPFGVELVGDAPGIPARAGQLGDPLGQLGVVTEVFEPLDRPADHLVGLLSAGPAHGDVDEFAAAADRDRDLVDDGADHFFAVGVCGARRRPQTRKIGGGGGDRGLLLRGQR